MSKPIGRELTVKWGVGALCALYSKTGNWYHNLTAFPGALFDDDGYVLFETRQDYESCPYLRISQDLWVPNRSSAIPSYVKAPN
jgi:5-methylcytosine-specific restriction protein A